MRNPLFSVMEDQQVPQTAEGSWFLLSYTRRMPTRLHIIYFLSNVSEDLDIMHKTPMSLWWCQFYVQLKKKDKSSHCGAIG